MDVGFEERDGLEFAVSDPSMKIINEKMNYDDYDNKSSEKDNTLLNNGPLTLKILLYAYWCEILV